MTEAEGPLKTYLCSYGYKGQRWSFELKAKSLNEAENRLRFLQGNGIVDGELMATIPVPSVLKRIWVWLMT